MKERDTEVGSNLKGTQWAVSNSRRVAAGKANRLKRKGLTDAGRQRLREAALKNRPWLHSTGPRTESGKERSARNGKVRQLDLFSLRELKADFADLKLLERSMSDTRASLGVMSREGS
jgi:hypothetical protein